MEESKKTYSEAAEPEEKRADRGESKLSEEELEAVSGGTIGTHQTTDQSVPRKAKIESNL